MAKRGGVGTLLASLRALLSNPMVRELLYASTTKRKCVYENGREVEASLLYHALARYSGDSANCPLTVSALNIFLKTMFKTLFLILNGNEEEAKKSLRDPSVRRGISLVLESLATYGVTVPQKMTAPFLIVWNFTNLCNLNCKHCYQRAGAPLKNELTLEEKIKAVEDLDRAGVAAIALSGGEPTIHPHFLRIVKEISDRGIYPAVATNGWMFANKTFLEKAMKAGLRYMEVSVDSSDPRKHDEFRGRKGAWERAIKALQNAVEAGINHAMAVTVTKNNLDEIEDILDLAESIGIKRVIFFNFVPTGRGEEIVEQDLDPIEREEFLRMIYREMKRRKIEIESTAPEYGRVTLQLSGNEEIAPTHFYVGGDPVIKSLAEFIGGCGAGRIYAALDPDGTVMPCVFLRVKVGNIKEKSFAEIWRSSPLMRALRDRNNLWGFCKNCPYREICGGCRARAYAYFKDPLGPDPGCIYNLKEWRQIVKELKQPVKKEVVATLKS